MSSGAGGGSHYHQQRRSSPTPGSRGKGNAFFQHSHSSGSSWGTGGAAGGGGGSGLSRSGSGSSYHNRSGSLPSASPLRYNSPTKRFGYMRWPPLISPTPTDGESGLHDDYADVRLEMERSGHNLTSVMMNPRESRVDELEAASQEPILSTVVPTILPPVSMEDVKELARRTGPILATYRQNHHSGSKLYRRDVATSRKGDGAADLADCFKQVPGIFFSRDFALSDLALFEMLVVNAKPDTQERLTQYLDIVETCLLKQISSRSQHFFEALTTLQDVRERVAQACHQVNRLRKGLHDIDRNTVMGMIRIPRLAQRKVNLASLLEKLRLIQDVQRSKELVQSLLTAGDYMGALDVLEDGRALMRDRLATVHCMRKLDRQLVEYLELVTDLMGSSFINLAVQLDDGFENEGDSSLPSSPQNHRPVLNETTAAELIPRIRGLVRLCRLSKVLERYRARLTDTLKGVVKTVLLEYLDMADYSLGEEAEHNLEESPIPGAAAGAAGEGGHDVGDAAILTTKVKGMEPGAFSDCLRLCFEQMLIPMKRVALIHSFLEEQMSLELSRLLDSRSRHPPADIGAGAMVSNGSSGDLSSSAYSSPTRRSIIERSASSISSISPGRSNSIGGSGSSYSSPSTKFKAFLDKRRMETTAGAFAKAFKDEDQIKVLELQACKRLNDEVLKTLCDLCQRHIASLLVTRKEAHVKLSLVEMKTLWDATTNFVAAMERISGTAGFGLKSTLLTQAKLFVEHMHDAYMAQLVAALDGEKWVQADVSPERQADIDRLTAGKAVMALHHHLQKGGQGSSLSGSGSTGDGQAGSTAGAAGWKRNASDGDENPLAVVPSAEVNGGHKKKKEPSEAVVDEGRYKVVWSAVLLVSMLMNYLNVAANFPTLTMDVMQRVVDLLRLFNARTTQLVLGAGAIHAAARLRSITAKHLALASQCLALVMVLLPHVRAALSAHLQAKQQAFLVELDRIKQEYMEHHEKILAKFVSIIGELVANSASSSLKETDWDNMGNTSCRFIEDVIKGVSTMHRVLYQHLPPAQVQDVFSRVFDLLTHRLKEYFEDVQPTTTAGKQRLVDEISHLVTSLSMLRAVDIESLSIHEEFKKKYGVYQ